MEDLLHDGASLGDPSAGCAWLPPAGLEVPPAGLNIEDSLQRLNRDVVLTTLPQRHLFPHSVTSVGLYPSTFGPPSTALPLDGLYTVSGGSIDSHNPSEHVIGSLVPCVYSSEHC